MDIKVSLRQTKSPLPARTIVRAAEAFLTSRGILRASLSIVLVAGPEIRKINRTHLGHDYVTDIITFDVGDGKPKVIEGELVICVPEAVRNARIYGVTPSNELLRYVAHGILHLLGHDDKTEDERQKMRRLEDKLLALVS